MSLPLSRKRFIINLRLAGIRNGTYTPVPGVNLTLVGEVGLAALAQTDHIDHVLLNNGWQRNSPQGFYGSNYADRASTAISGDLEQTLDQVLYAEHLDVTPT
jgi:hypothetical protein